MEGHEVFRVLSLVVTWAIPATLILAVAAFILAAPVLALAGVILRLYGAAREKLQRKSRAEVEFPIDTQAVQWEEAAEKHATEKELVGTRS